MVGICMNMLAVISISHEAWSDGVRWNDEQILSSEMTHGLSSEMTHEF